VDGVGLWGSSRPCQGDDQARLTRLWWRLRGFHVVPDGPDGFVQIDGTHRPHQIPTLIPREGGTS
jgi:hypothetical protein